MDSLDVVYVLPPSHLVWEQNDLRWNTLTNATDGRALAHSHLMENNTSSLTAQIESPFALMGDKLDMAKVRTSEVWLPP